MPKLFCVSDIHSFYYPLKTALDKAGFDENNENHWLIVCGDAFDRGPDSEEVLRYLMSLNRKILVKGNHDILLEECCNREFPYRHDIHNGTVKTVQDLGDMSMGYSFDTCCEITNNKLTEYRKLLVNYFETEKYIFVHSWIPLCEDEYREDWRDANDIEWHEAMWGNPFELANKDLNKTGKTIVFGHWHCSAGHKMLGNCNSEFEYTMWEPCYFKNTIGIDKCTVHTGEVNVLMIEDDFLKEI